MTTGQYQYPTKEPCLKLHPSLQACLSRGGGAQSPSLPPMGGTGPLYVLCGADPWGRSWGRPCRSFCAARFGASSSRWRAPTRADLRRARRPRLAPQPASNRARARLRRDEQIQILALIATRSRSADAGCGAETEFDSRPRLVTRAGRGASARWASSPLSVSSLSLDSPFVCLRFVLSF